jgi:magnesium transporter
MRIFHFSEGKPSVLPDDAALPDQGLIWVDFLRDDAQGWECWAEPLIGTPIDPEHVSDSLNPTHPSFFDGTSEYDMLVFEGLGPRPEPLPLETRTATFFMFERVLITVRAVDSVSVDHVRQRLLDGRMKTPSSPMRLALLIVDAMVDRFLLIRDVMDTQFTKLQDDLLDPAQSMNDWRELLRCRREVRRLEALSESQLEALDAWRRGSCFDWDSRDEVRIRDLNEHVNRVLTHASGQERDLEAAIQLHFASVSHRTNRVVQGLTVLSAIFFPLTLITGIYGMNFKYMPELEWEYGYYFALGLLATIGGGLWWYFRRRRFL